MSRFSSQYDTLTDRQLTRLLGSPGRLLLLLAQPPLVGFFIGFGWADTEGTQTTLFMMALAGVWLGCMNACCEIVGERTIFNRERMFNLSIWAYLLSKISVLSFIAAIQAALLLYCETRYVHLPGNFLIQFLYFLFLTATSIAASALGLLISACCRSTYAAVMTVPILLIPQVVFSEILLQDQINRKVPALLEKLTLTKWSHDALVIVNNNLDSLDWGGLIASLAMLTVAVVGLLVLAAFKLKMDDV